MTYTAPLQNMIFVLEDLCDLDQVASLPGLEDATPDMVRAIIKEASKYASQVLAPMNHAGDRSGLGFVDGLVTTPADWKPAYRMLVEAGWNSPAANPEYGGMGLPQLVNAAVQEMFQGANMSFQLCPMLTQGAIEAIEAYASNVLKHAYLPKLVSGLWAGTMNLTEPQAGSDLAAVRSKAVPEGDHYRISGQKTFITYGEHDLAENIIHLVLARLPDAPAGVKGISLFVVPKILVNADGSLGARNDVRCVSIEHKLGIHASPTCTLSFGDEGGAMGYLVGEPNRGLEYMFAMMNNARLNVGMQGIGVAEHATQHAIRYAAERKQGKPADASNGDTILGHPDVRRMLAVMRARTDAARIVAYRAARSLDFAKRAEEGETRAVHQRRVDLLIPVVKGWSTEMAVGTTSLGVQVYGGMGYVEETGAAQHFRDARITTIYEGTTGIQALDLVGRKILRDGGRAAGELIGDIRSAANDGDADMAAMAAEAADLIDETVAWLLRQEPKTALAAGSAVLELFGLCTGGWAMADAARAAETRIAAGQESNFLRAKLLLARIYATHVFPQARACRDVALNGTAAILELPAAWLKADN
ncbi:acyl-CoA dehydrogenase [Bosea sp. (in: a-proteobacteria)]|uniref:acyl-CoA dehydrogenase n=1 Tax=Bosea sp. (in: a-proteobacteria) TaxID=1871050 RepID=UPI00261C84CE|nr:acyl-CoA dehydrogenase [Bosea sp. (in: a-proteobacteria)]MCO5089456.1 acyl-CoA dehydrogenase [Bosea sp. (in: a-proteobacteria)]